MKRLGKRIADSLLSPPLFLLVVYGGAYVGMLQTETWTTCFHSMSLCSRTAEFRIKHKFVAKLFEPALWIDQRIRPGFWTWTETVVPIEGHRFEYEIVKGRFDVL